MIKKIFIGIIISGIFVYLALKNVDFNELKKAIQNADYIFILPSLILGLLAQWVRAFRWGIILQSIKKINQWTLFSITSVGFLAIVLLPARLGEFARPILISEKENISKSSTIATIVVERFFDIFIMIILFFFVLLSIQLPDILIKAGYTVLIFFSVSLIILIFLWSNEDRAMNIIGRIGGYISYKISFKIQELLRSFFDGMDILPDWRRMFMVLLSTLLIWTIFTLAIYSLFFAFSFELPFIAALALNIIIALGIMIPTAPGMIGNFHFSTILGLTIFRIPKTEALSYSIVLHFLMLSIVVIFGIIFMYNTKISFHKLINMIKIPNRDK